MFESVSTHMDIQTDERRLGELIMTCIPIRFASAMQLDLLHITYDFMENIGNHLHIITESLQCRLPPVYLYELRHEKTCFLHM